MPRSVGSLKQSIICTAVFAAVFGFIVSCGGNGSNLALPGQQAVARLVSSLSSKPSMNIFPSQASADKPVLASMLFFAAPTSSQLQQTFQADCDLTNTAALVPPNNFVFLVQPIDRSVPSCSQSTIMWNTEPVAGVGTPMFFSGTLSSLVATAYTAAGGNSSIRCSDLTTTAAVADQQQIQAYFNPTTNAVILATGATQLPFNCVLPVPAGDSVTQLNVQWGKI